MKPEALQQNWLTVKEVATHVRVHPHTILRWLNAGYLRGARVGPGGYWRIMRQDLEALEQSFFGDVQA